MTLMKQKNGEFILFCSGASTEAFDCFCECKINNSKEDTCGGCVFNNDIELIEWNVLKTSEIYTSGTFITLGKESELD